MTSAVQQMKLPDILATWSWPRKLNPLYDEVKAECMQSFYAFNALSPSALKAFEGFDLCLLTALAYPWAGKERLRSGCDMMNIFFLLDDVTDGLDEGGARIIAYIVEDVFLNPQKPRPDGESILGQMVKQFWQDALIGSSLRSQRRFVKVFTSYLNGTVQQAADRDHNYVRTINEYWGVRRETIGARPCFALIDFDLDLPDYVVNHPAVLQLSDCACDLITISNDLCSYNKEQAAGDDTHNIVGIVMHELDTDIHGALRWVDDHARTVVAKFMNLIKEIPSWGRTIDNQVEIYVRGLGTWVRANDTWGYECTRYFGTAEKGLEIQKCRMVDILPGK